MLGKLIAALFGGAKREAARENDAAIALANDGKLEEALAAFTRAVALNPSLLAAQINRGNLLFQLGRYRDARDALLAARGINAENLEAIRLLGLAYYEIGEVDHALAVLAATEGARGDVLCLEYRAFIGNAEASHTANAHFDVHLAWARAFTAAHPATTHARNPPRRTQSGDNSRGTQGRSNSHGTQGGDNSRGMQSRSNSIRAQHGDRFTVGFVSAEFREHAVANFLLPAIAGHDPHHVKVICYANNPQHDALTREFQSHAAVWRPIDALDDGAVAQTIREDGVDILIDCSGHTRGHRLGVFALRPAPVQVSWLGYFNTTALPAIDYRLTDANFDPPGVADPFHTEQLRRIEATSWCYRPAPAAPPVGATPCETQGHLTFGSFNHVAKLNDAVIALWSRILRDIPESILKLAALPDALTTERILQQFERHGVQRERLRPLPRMRHAQFLAEIERTDLALDPFPYSGGATTCDCLWMGVPVITLAGDFGFARSAAAALTPAGLTQFIATSPEDYVRIATAISTQGATRGAEGSLASLRSSMRERLAASPLMDEAAFRARFYGALRTLLDSPA